jgi:hypothetical protein
MERRVDVDAIFIGTENRRLERKRLACSEREARIEKSNRDGCAPVGIVPAELKKFYDRGR